MGNGASGGAKAKKEKKEKQMLLQTCENHEGSINCMEVSEDGSVLVTGSDDSNLRLWSTKTETVECIGVLEGHEDYITSVLIEDNFVLSSSADKTIKKWDMYSCECLLTYLGHESTVNKLVCTGDFLFSVSYDKKARCWDFDTGECVRVFSGHKSNVTSILFIPADKDNLNDAMNFVQQHAAKNRGIQNKAKQEEDEDDVYKRDLIITGSLDSLAKSWSIESGEAVQTFKGHTAAITCLATDPFGKLLFTGSADHSIRSWEIMTGQALKVFTGHQTTIITLLAHRKILYSAASDHTARSWVMEFGDCTRVYKDHTHSVSSIIENQGLIYTGCGDSNARCFDAKSGGLKQVFKGHTGSINCLRIVGNRLFTGSFDTTICVWDTSDLFAEKGTGAREREKKEIEKPNEEEEEIRTNSSQNNRIKTSQNSRLTVENEKSFMSQNHYNQSYGGYPKSADIRTPSQADSGFDDPYGGYNANRSSRPRKTNMNDLV